MTIRLNQVYGALAPLTEGNFQFGLNYGSGLGVSSGQLVNTGVLSLQGDTGSLSLGAGTGIGISGLTISNTGIISASAGSGISVSGTNPLTITNTGIISASAGNGISVSGTNPLTITNTGVLSLQGDTGALSLSAGTGIGISGLTISNTGIISASAGNGISVSGTNPLTITNTGVLSLQGDTGTLSLSAGTGIGISGLTISNTGIISASAGSGISVSGTNPLTITNTGVLSLSSNGSLNLSGSTGSITISLNTGNSNSWSATQTIGALTVDDAVGGTPFTPNGNTAFAFYNGGVSNYVGQGEWLGFWRDNGNYFAPLIGEQNGAFIIAFANDSATTYNGLNANRGTMAFQVEPSGAVYTGINQGYFIPTTGSNSIAIRNTLDDGSGNMFIGGSFSSSGNMTVGGNFTVNEDINVGGILTVSDNVTIGGTLTVDSLTQLQYYHSTTFTALYTTTNTNGVSGSFALGFYTTLTNSMHVNIGTSTISVFSIFGEHNDGGSTGVGVLLTSVSYGVETNIPYGSSDIIAYFPAISTAGNTSDSSSTQTWIASGVASTNGSCYITIVCEQSYASHILEFNQTVITFP